MPDEIVERLRLDFPRVTFHEGKVLGGETLAMIDAAFVTEMIPDEAIERMPRLRWLHGTYGSVSSMLTASVRARPILLTSSSGIHAVPFAEFTIAAIFALAKRLPTAVLAQSEHRWEEGITSTVEVEGKTLGLVGLGVIGTAVARKGSALGMRVIAIRKHPDDKPPFVDWVGPPEALHDLLSASDFVALCAASTDATAGLIDEAALRAMKPTAYLLNLVMRNAVPDEEMVARALREGWIAGAMFNVFPTRGRGKIADDSPLWDAPNFLISPRLAALDPRKWDRTHDLFADNLRRFLADEPLLNLWGSSARS